MIAATYITNYEAEQRCFDYIETQHYKHGSIFYFEKECMLKQAEGFDVLVVSDSQYLQAEDRQILKNAGVRIELA